MYRASTPTVRATVGAAGSLTVVVLFALALFAGGAAASPVDVADCRTIDAAGTYVLTGDVNGSGHDVCLEIASSDVVLDGNGHAVAGEDGYRTTGIYANGTDGRLHNVTVLNVTATDWFTGIYHRNVSDVTIDTATTASNGDRGILLRSVDGFAVRHTSTSDHGAASEGVMVVGSSNGTVAGVTATDEGRGVSIVGSRDVAVRESTFVRTATAVRITASGGVVVDGNVIEDGGIAYVQGSDGPANRVTNNTASTDAWDGDCGGVTVNGGADDVVAHNVIEDCYSGALIQKSDGVTFENNTVLNSDRHGVFVNQGSGVALLDNRIENNGRGFTPYEGVLLQVTEHATLTGNRLAGNGYNIRIVDSQYAIATVDHGIDGTNTVEGRPVAYHVNETNVTVDPNAGWVGLVNTRSAVVRDTNFPENNYENVYLWDADDTVIRNVTSTTGWLGVRIHRNSDRTRIEDSSFDGGYGLKLSRSGGTHLLNTTVTGSKNYGVVLYQSPNTTFETVTLAGNDRYAVYVQSGSQGLTVAGSTVENNGGGLLLERAHRSTVRDSTIRNNGGAGIIGSRYFNNATVANNTITGNDGDGVSVSSYAADNAVVDNTITDNGANGIELGFEGHGDVVTGNVLVGNAVGLDLPRLYDDLTVYDNRFNNTANVAFGDPAGVTNATWNVQAATGTNVIGGPTVAGNYWAAIGGDGFSETCTDRGDGVCDTAYTVAAGHVDDLPLAATSVPSLADYVNADGVVDTGGLRDGIDDWRTGTIDTDLLRSIVDYWRSGRSLE